MIPDNLHPSLQQFLDYWNDKRGDNPVPRRADIEPTEMPSLLSGICILDLEFSNDGFERAKFRLAGTQIYEMVGYEVTDRYIDEIMPAAVYSEVKSQLRRAIDEMKPTYRRFSWENSSGSNATYERILAPVGEPGKPIEQFIGMHIVLSEEGINPLEEHPTIPLG